MPDTAAQATETCKVPMLDTRAAPMADSYNEAERTVDFVASTGARGLRRPWFGDDYYEELEISEQAVRLGRLNNGAPFLNTHRQYGIEHVLGSIQRAWIEDGAVRIRVKFSKRAEVETILQDIRDGVLPHVSLGYFVHRWDVTEQVGELDVRRAVDWEPAECSLVPIGFDDAATVRSGETEVSQAIINRSTGPLTGGQEMPTENRNDSTQTPVGNTAPDNSNTTERSGADPAGTTPAATPEPQQRSQEDNGAAVRQAAQEAAQAERQRYTEIRRAVRAARLGDDLADTLITEGATIEQARARIIDEWAQQDDSEDTTAVRTGVDLDVVGRVREHAAEAILLRGGVQVDTPDPQNGFRNMSMMRIAEELLQNQGVNCRGMTPMDLASRALTTSDLPFITGTVMNRTLLQGYESAPRTFVGVFRQASANDFREITRVRLSEAPMLDEVPEKGEFKYGSVSDEAEAYRLVTYGKILCFTRQALINDDLDAMIRIPTLFGRAAADLESDVVWDIVTSNAALQDGIALFAAQHNNLAGSGGAINVTTVGAARAAMRKQTGIKGRVLNIMPQYLIAGADKETEADQLLTAITPDQVSNAVPAGIRSMTPVIEPRLPGNAWYLAANYNQVDTIEYCYLSGQQGVYLDTREGFSTDGIEIKARHDFAAKAIDYRGLYRNPGA